MTIRILSALLCLMALAGCGGGGGDEDEDDAPASPPAALNLRPTASIRTPSTAIAFGKVRLESTGSNDSDGQITRYQWSQSSGPAITIVEGIAGSAHFIAPEVAGTVRVALTVTDNLGASGTAQSDIVIVAASAEQQTVSIVATQLATRLPEGGHTDYSTLRSSPRVNATLLLAMSLNGPVDEQNARFSLVAQDGSELGIVNLEVVSDPAVQPMTFVGEFTVPTQRFSVRAAGRSRRGQDYSLGSTEFFSPTRIHAQFEPKNVAGPVGAVRPFQLKITNEGSADQFTVHFEDPAHVIPLTPDIVRTIQSGETFAVDLQAIVPSTLSAREMLIAQISTGAGDTATHRFWVWQEITP